MKLPATAAASENTLFFVPRKCSGKRRQTYWKVLSLFFLLAEPEFRWSGEPIVLRVQVCQQGRAERREEHLWGSEEDQSNLWV